METYKTYGNSIMKNFLAQCSKALGAPLDLPGRLLRNLVRLFAWCFA